MSELTDESLMPFGVHKGTKMANVPAKYLLYLYDMDYCYGAVKDYIKENENVLRKELEETNNKFRKQ